jgi:N-acetylgalactosamine-6-phosphate deacetylase
MGSSQYYRAHRILHGNQWLEDGVIAIDEQGVIIAIESYDNSDHHSATDLGQVTLMPGLIDTHVHGAKRCDVMDASHDSLNTMSQFLPNKA